MEITKESNAIEMVCQTVTFRKENAQRFHWHEKYEICQPLTADCSFSVDGKLVHARCGDLVVFDYKEIHRFLIEEDEIKIRVLQFPTKVLLNSGLPTGWIQTHISCDELQQYPAVDKAVASLLDLMEEEAAVHEGGKNVLMQSLVVSLCFLLRKYFPAKEKRRIPRDVGAFFEIVEYVNAHFDEEAGTVENVAQQLGFSRERLSAVFLQYAGISLKNYMNTLRVDCANRLLMNGSNASTAAYTSGFNSIRTFNNVYKNITGLTPTEYLRVHKPK